MAVAPAVAWPLLMSVLVHCNHAERTCWLALRDIRFHGTPPRSSYRRELNLNYTLFYCCQLAGHSFLRDPHCVSPDGPVWESSNGACEWDWLLPGAQGCMVLGCCMM
jgi:hypothetical protein